MAMELIKEDIECEQLLGENFSDTVVKSEYVIPDTHPDVYEILMLDAKPVITSKEVMQDKIYLEGQVEYNVLYLAKEEEGIQVHNAVYTGKFTNYIELNGAEHKMECEAECYIEHMECNIVNERKISIEGIIKLKSSLYKNYQFQVVKDIEGEQDIQMLKNPASIDKIAGIVDADLIAKCHIQIPNEKPEIENIIKHDISIHKKEVRVLDGKIRINAWALIGILYKGKNTRDLIYIENDVPLEKEVDADNVTSLMDNFTDFRVDADEINVGEDDLGESRIIDVESLIKANVKVMNKEDMDIIEDVYTPTMLTNMDKKDYVLNVMHGHRFTDTIIKGDIEIQGNMPRAAQIIMANGQICVTDKKIVEGKVIVEGILRTDVLYKSVDEENYICTVKEEIPFNCSVDMPGSKIDMQCITKAYLESIEASIEANNISIKAIAQIYTRVNYITHKEFIVDISQAEGEVPQKKSSITIYVVQHSDTLWKIAKKYNTTTNVLTTVNNIENPDAIKPGEKLIIPGRAII